MHLLPKILLILLITVALIYLSLNSWHAGSTLNKKKQCCVQADVASGSNNYESRSKRSLYWKKGCETNDRLKLFKQSLSN